MQNFNLPTVAAIGIELETNKLNNLKSTLNYYFLKSQRNIIINNKWKLNQSNTKTKAKRRAEIMMEAIKEAKTF
jgi:hypothetical protein